MWYSLNGLFSSRDPSILPSAWICRWYLVAQYSFLLRGAPPRCSYTPPRPPASLRGRGSQAWSGAELPRGLTGSNRLSNSSTGIISIVAWPGSDEGGEHPANFCQALGVPSKIPDPSAPELQPPHIRQMTLTAQTPPLWDPLHCPESLCRSDWESLLRLGAQIKGGGGDNRLNSDQLIQRKGGG